MMKDRRFFFIAALLIILSCDNKNKKITVEVKILPNYPSASGIEYFHNKIYIIGDDANNLLVLDSNLNLIDSIQLYSFPEKRIPKAIKPDLESMTMAPDGRLLVLGSGSLAPYRHCGWLIDPATKQKDSIRFSYLYPVIPAFTGIKEVNIEGAAYMSEFLLLANRGNKSYPENHLLFISQAYPDPKIHSIQTCKIGGTDSNVFNGVSGLSYSAASDMLICTVSTEDTRNSLDDGAIGKSYLWIVKELSSKRNRKTITPDKIIDLDAIDSMFNGQKIESVCITKETDKELLLLLAADNDNGSSTLFRLAVNKD